MIELSCPQCQERAPELALGVLEGRDRAETLAHLEQCGRCQDRVADLARTACLVVDLLPESDPPHGFDERVLAALAQPAITPCAHPSSTSRQRIPVAAAVLAAALLAGGGVSASADPGDKDPWDPPTRRPSNPSPI